MVPLEVTKTVIERDGSQKTITQLLRQDGSTSSLGSYDNRDNTMKIEGLNLPTSDAKIVLKNVKDQLNHAKRITLRRKQITTVQQMQSKIDENNRTAEQLEQKYTEMQESVNRIQQIRTKLDQMSKVQLEIDNLNKFFEQTKERIDLPAL